jgi:predicted MPP superfamily phosphohydrolase
MLSARTLSWLHLSDLHLEASPNDPNRAARDHERCLRAVEVDIAGFRADAGLGKPVRSPDIVLVSGDVVRAGSDTGMFECAHAWIARFCAAAELPTDRVFVVPGNHDIDRSRVQAVHHDLLDFSKCDTASFRQEVDKIWDSPATVAEVNDKLAAYHAFAGRYAPVTRADLGSWRTSVEVNGITVDLIGLSSVWTGGTDALDKPGFPAIGQIQRETVDEIAASFPAGDVVLVLQHNPTSYLNSIDALQHETWLDEKDAIVYSGHLHQSAMAERRSMFGRHLELMGGALYATYAGRRQYSMGTMVLDVDERGFSIALRGAHGDSESTFRRDTHRYPGARNGVAQFEQSAKRANLGHRPPHRDQLEIDLERAFLRFDDDRYAVNIEKTYSNPTERIWTHVEALVLVNAFPDDPVRSRELYRKRPLELEDIAFAARRDGAAIDWQVVHDLDSSKELQLILGDGSDRNPGLEPGGITVLDYSFTIDRARWGPYFERHIRRPTARIYCELDFPASCLTELLLIGNRNITNRDLSTDLECDSDGVRRVWRWEKDDPHLQSRYRFSWRFEQERG